MEPGLLACRLLGRRLALRLRGLAEDVLQVGAHFLRIKSRGRGRGGLVRCVVHAPTLSPPPRPCRINPAMSLLNRGCAQKCWPQGLEHFDRPNALQEEALLLPKQKQKALSPPCGTEHTVTPYTIATQCEAHLPRQSGRRVPSWPTVQGGLPLWVTMERPPPTISWTS